MSKKIGKWFVPDDEQFSDVLKTCRTGNWSCIDPLEKSFKYVKRFHKAIDVGTWIGDSTSVIHNKFCKTIGFEANPEVYDCCKQNLKKIKNLTLHNIALSNSSGYKTLLNGPSSFSGWINTLDSDTLNQQRLTKKINIKSKVLCKTLDSFNFRGINFLKLDADSHEGFILKGSMRFFTRNNPVILLEYKPKVLIRQDPNMPDAIKLLESIGYEIVEQAGPIDFILVRVD